MLVAKIFDTQEFPVSLKEALLFPIHKSGSMSKIQNFRPISLLPVLTKVVEKVMAA